jgi:3-dehydroquinate dehydratase/shikimate dehydrogenase
MILANTTSAGMEPRIPSEHYSLVFNTIYTPKLASLLREAQEAGSTIV